MHRFLFSLPAMALCAVIGPVAVSLSIPAPVLAQSAPPPPRSAGAAGAMVDAFRAGDAARVRQMGDIAGAVGVRWATWSLLRAGDVTDFATYHSFVRAHPDWPGMDLLRRQGERRIDGADPALVLDWFRSDDPQTAQGAVALIAALTATGGDPTQALRSAWIDHDLTEAQETALLAQHAAALAPFHTARLNALLWRAERDAAERMLPRVDDAHQRLARARLALQRRQDGVNALIDAVPASLAADPGLAYDRFRWRLNAGLTDSAAELLASLPAEALGRPERWAGQRARLARRAMAEGDSALAYRLAANHGLDDGVARADLEFLAGFIALRQLNRPADAVPHFQRLREGSTSPITLGRAHYWEGRALEALGQTDAARAAYAQGAQHQTAFYGQLAAERIGQPLDATLISAPRYPDWRETRLATSDLMQVALMLYRLGDWYEARRFTLHLASTLTSEPELGALAQLWLDRDEPNFALKIAKEAVGQGVLLPRAYFPLHSGLMTADLAAPRDLALAIARRESEFDPRVTSHADARGLMQVLPATGAQVARRLGLEYHPDMLTRDPALNAVLGAAYLDQIGEEFGDTLSLVAAGYNAGPGRPRRWITEFGDPRDPGTDPVDWVEAVPFTETRNYIMRVTESVILYRAILSGSAGPIRLTDILRGRN